MNFDGTTLVTGAAGFIGRHLVEHLVALGARVRATDLPRRDTSYFDSLGVEFVGADLTKPESLPALFAGEVDRVFHLGAICNFSTPYRKLHPVNVLAVDHITRLALDAGVKRYVHIGSTSVYGPYQGTPFTEDAPRNPQDAYGRSKRDGEDVVWQRIRGGLLATITRPCTVYGPGCSDGAGKVFSRQTSITAIPKNGRQLLSNVRVEDVAAAVVHLSHIDEAVGKAFNIADDSHPTVEEALAIAARTFGAKPPRLHLPLTIVKAFARLGGVISSMKGRIPDLECDALRYLGSDYVVDNTRLKSTADKGRDTATSNGHQGVRPAKKVGRMLARGKVPDRQRSPRVQRLRERIVDAPREVCIERARYLTQSMAANWGLHPLTRMSMALEHVLENMSVIIRDDELIVGCRTGKLKGAPLFPENKSRWIEVDLETFAQRSLQEVLITEEEQRELQHEILPFWRGRTAEDRLEELLPPDVAEDIDKYVFTTVLEITYGIGHFTMDHPRVLKQGLSGIIAEAERRLDAMTPEERLGEKGLFYDAVIRSLRATVRFAHRYADLAASLAANEADPEWAEELRTIARVCRRVPEHPARTFHEAVQFVYFVHLVAQIESGGNSISLGRIDQILYPYYAADRQAGRITPEQGREVLSLLFLKTNEIWNILEEAFIPGGEGPEGKTTQNVTVGGVGPDGEDATNELSYIGLDAFADVRTVQPNFGVRLSSKAPEDFFRKAVEYARDGVLLHLFNDDAIIKSLRQAGHTLEDARDYGVVGCLEPNAQGKSFCSTFAVQFGGIKCLELALSNGVDNIFGYQSGIQSGDPATFASFDDVWNAYDAQVSYFMRQMVRGMAVLDQAISELVPSPFAAAMIDGPMEKGLDLTRGGAIYNATGVQLMGFSNVVDSLYAVKKAVFEDRVMSLGQLALYLAEDWDQAEDKRAYLLHKVPKYGNDNDEVDALAARVLEHFCDEVLKNRNYRGGSFWPGVFTVGFHIAMGAFAGASADGRHAGEVLGNGITPSNGNALSGPTAVFNSVTKLPLSRVHNGLNLNMRFNPSGLKPEVLTALTRTYFQRGGCQVQFNMVDSATLRDAQARPEKYRDLVVRVSGYSALFTGLSETAQNEIISRTEYEL